MMNHLTSYLHESHQTSVINNNQLHPCVTIVESVELFSELPSLLTWNGTLISPNTCKSAKQKLGLLYHNFQQVDQKTLVLSRLDYGSCIHYPPSITLSDKLESIQGFAAKLCMKWWSAPSTLDLNWPTLRSRSSRQKVLLCRHIIKQIHHFSILAFFSPSSSSWS